MEIKKVYVYPVVAILIACGYFAYKFYEKNQLVSFELDKKVSEFEDLIPSECEAGQWTEFPSYDKSGNFTEYKGNAKLKSTASDDEFVSQDGFIYFITDTNYSLTFFENLDVRIEGVDIGLQNKKEIYVKRIKCVGKEANQDIRTERQNLMEYIASNINSLAMEKSHNKPWEVQTFYFVNDTDLYVEYESPSSIGGDSLYDAHLWLIRVSNTDTPVPTIETLGYIQEDEEDPEKNVVKTGEDLYKDNEDMTVYELDDKKNWVMQ